MKFIKRESPAPLLIVLVSFDPSREGIDHYDPEHPELLTDKDSPYYGEQWISSTPQHYYDTFFKEDGNSLIDYYKEMTGGKNEFVYLKGELAGLSDSMRAAVLYNIWRCWHKEMNVGGSYEEMIKAYNEGVI